MSKHFIKNINIKYFKCFNDFEAKDLKRVNLITGKNNVGKTAFMEACYINVHSTSVDTMMYALNRIKFFREELNILHYSKNTDPKIYDYSTMQHIKQADGVDITSNNTNQVSLNIKKKNGETKYHFKFLDEDFSVNVNSLNFNIVFNINSVIGTTFIDNFGLTNIDIIDAFVEIQRLNRESFLNEILNNFDNSITNFKVMKKPQCEIRGKYRDITELGDGTRHLVSIVASLFKCKDGYLFIDEINNGIHYEQLDNVWRIVLEVSKEFNVQVFATTHSKECLESYVRVVKQLKDEDITLVELGESDKKLKNIVFNYDGMIHQVEQKLEVRGWQ